MSDERPDALLRSALEKIVYFEARSEQVQRDLDSARAEGESLKRELGFSAQREIELRREIAELQVQVTRLHREREEQGRLNDALRSERANLIGKLVEASRIYEADQAPDADAHFDLASFIAELRSEALTRGAASAVPAPAVVQVAAVEAKPSGVAVHAQRFKTEGRLTVTALQLSELSAGAGFPGRTEETLFGFSMRELASPDAAARSRAADRLKSLGTPAAAPALATALHAEQDPSVQVTLLGALAAVGAKESAELLQPHLTSSQPEVRIAALRTLLTLNPSQGAPHLAAAMRDPEPSVRRRASLFALELSGDVALAVGEQAVGDLDADVRSLGARVLGAAGGERARFLLQTVVRDRDVKVRRAAAQGLSRILGEDVSNLVELDDVQRRREVRRLATLPSRPVQHVVPPPAVSKAVQRVADALPPAAPVVSEALCGQVASELRMAIRGRTAPELAQLTQAAGEAVLQACELLVARGQLVRRGQKYFVA